MVILRRTETLTGKKTIMSGFMTSIPAVSVGYFAARAAFGTVLFSRPGLGAATLALLFGLFAVMYGVSQIIIGIQVHSTGQLLGTAS
jgi:uncharacterized membrane protein HdeD (DUF308 family)